MSHRLPLCSCVRRSATHGKSQGTSRLWTLPSARRHVAPARKLSLACGTAHGRRPLVAGHAAAAPTSQRGNMSSQSPGPDSRQHRRVRRPARYGVCAALLAALLLGHGYVADTTRLSDAAQTWLYGRPLNERTFVPFVVVSNEPVSATAHLIVVAPRRRAAPAALAARRRIHAPDAAPLGWQADFPFLQLHLPRFLLAPHAHAASLARAWRHGLWSVEVKQPELQVARAYTPLPPLLSSRHGKDDDAADDDIDSGVLRFLVRRVNGGEVSTYLTRLRPGDAVELRGPHLGFDVRARLGTAGTDVAFLAAGTGIAPAMQVARAVLDDDNDDDLHGARGTDEGITTNGRSKPRVRILWANRRADECVGCEALLGRAGPVRTAAAAAAAAGGPTPANPIVTQLAKMQARHGDRLAVLCSVDAGGTSVSPAAIESLVDAGAGGARALSAATSRARRASAQSSCAYHSQTSLAYSPERDTEQQQQQQQQQQQRDKVSPPPDCPCSEAGDSAAGKKLFMLSGPDGFVRAYAGPKMWDRGQELQGAVGGVVGGLMRKDPGFWADWLVLKL